MPDIERADRTVPLPARASSWTAEEAQNWVRTEVLFGGPPDKPIDPSTGQEIDWAAVRQYAGERLRFKARPMGLLFPMADGSRRYVPGDASSSSSPGGFTLGTSTEKMREYSEEEKKLRAFCRNEIERYNKTTTAEIRRAKRRATYEFWEAGKRIRAFLAQNPDLNQDRVWYSLEQWGRGAGGYAKNWYEDATYFFDWRPDLSPDDPAFALSETRIMNIRRASKSAAGRIRLLQASVNGIFKELTDEEFKWATGQSRKTFKLGDEDFAAFSKVGRSIAQGYEPGRGDLAVFGRVLEKLGSKASER